MTIFAVYVDDLIIIAQTLDEMDKVKENLEDKFKMKNMGQLASLCTALEQEELSTAAREVECTDQGSS